MKLVRSVPRLPARPRAAHKGTFGTVVVIAGSEGMLGAAILCARAALRGGAGLVRAVLPPELRAPFTVAVPGATTLPRRSGRDAVAALAGADAIVIGPGLGLGGTTKAVVHAVLRRASVPVVVDADALNVLAPLRLLPTRADVVLTPHPGEAARLLGTESALVQIDRRGALQQLCKRSGHCVVLKGAGTLVGHADRFFVNTTGNPGMATGGSGDVLSGLLAALLAQGLAPFDAARLAVHVHGKAGDRVAERLSQTGLIAEDLPLAIAEELRP